MRDGEDMAVAVAYSGIRRQMRRLGYVLDGVTVGRLVVVEGGGRGGVLVDAEDRTEEEEDAGKGEEENERKAGGEKEKEQGERDGDGETEEKGGTQEKGADATQTRQQQPLKFAGLRDWSSCVFGDPLLATVFSDPLLQQHQHQHQPSTAFLQGFNGSIPDSRPSSPTRLPFPLNRDIIEDIDTAWIRLLLYQVYHAVARIVREFYRPRPDSSARELEARKSLNEVLAKLAEVPDDPKRRHQRPSGEMSPAKRVKGLGDE